METRKNLKTTLPEKIILNDTELENISGGGALSYAIEAACAALGAYFASVAYDNSVGDFLHEQQMHLAFNWAKTSKAVKYVDTASKWVVISQGALWAAALAKAVCEKLHIK